MPANGYRHHRLKHRLPTWVSEMQAQQDLIGEALAMLINGVADLEQRLGDRIGAEAGKSENRIIERLCATQADIGRQLAVKVDAEAADLRQVANLLSRKSGRTTSRIRCVFLVHAIESWDAQIDIYESMRRDPRFDPIVASINRRFPGDAGFGGEARTSAALDAQGIAHLRLGMEPASLGLDILGALAPDVIFRQSQWEDDVPPAFSTARLNFARICSVPYAISTISKFSPDEASVAGATEKSFDQVHHRMAWRIFCETEQARDYFLQFRHCDPAKLVVSGYPKLTRLLRARHEPERWPIADDGQRRFRVIWAPHHSLGANWLGFGVFDRICSPWLAWACARPDIEFVLKPHPALFNTAVRSGVMSQQALDAFLAQWKALPNCEVETGAYGHLFAASDMMVTDGVSFLTEYPLFEKPLVFFDSGRHVPMNRVGDAALACAHHVRDFATMRDAVEAYALGAAWPLEKERERLIDMLLPQDGDPASFILDSIADGLPVEQRASGALAVAD